MEYRDKMLRAQERGEMLLSMSKIVFQVIALGLEVALLFSFSTFHRVTQTNSTTVSPVMA